MARQPRFEIREDADVVIRGYSPRIKDLADRTEVREIITYLHFDHLYPEGKEKRIRDSITVRLDRQGNPGAAGGGANLQIQINDAALSRLKPRKKPTEGSTIVQVIVPAAIHQAALDCNPEGHIREHLESKVRSALWVSFNAQGGHQFTIVES